MVVAVDTTVLLLLLLTTLGAANDIKQFKLVVGNDVISAHRDEFKDVGHVTNCGE